MTSAAAARSGVLDALRAQLVGDLEPAEVAERLAGALVPGLGVAAAVLLGSAAGWQRVAVRGAFDETGDPELHASVIAAFRGAPPCAIGSSGQRVVVAGLPGELAPCGVVLLAGASGDDETLLAFDHAATLAGHVLTLARVRARSRASARHAQHVASQLHQLLAASIAIGGLQDATEIVESVAQRIRVVFGGDVAVVSAVDEQGDATFALARATGRSELVDRDVVEALGLPEAAADPSAAGVVGDWLLAPMLVRRGDTQGVLAVHRDGEPFDDDDVEVVTLLAQTAGAALASSRLHRTVARSEERLRVLVDAAPAAIVETDAAGRIAWWNLAAARLFGWSARAEADAPSFPEGAIPALAEAWAEAIERDDVVASDVTVELPSGRRDLMLAVATVPPTADQGSGILTLVEDVTERRQLMEELRHAQRMDVIGQLASSVAHDFNNLLTLIAGYAELLEGEVGSAERPARLAADILATTQRASTLTGKLLTMARTKTPTPVVFSPAAVVRGLAEVLDRIVGRDVALVLEVDDDAGNVRADPDQFEQAIMNLATNARDAMPDGGTLRVSVGRAGPSGPERVRIVVADTGHGMDEATLQQAFEPLFTTKGPTRGTGLGLPAARRVVTDAGGTLHCESTPGVGTTFEIELPVVADAVAAVTELPEPAPVRAGGTVLLAEDEAGIRDLAERVLARGGYDVVAVENAEAALELAAGSGPFDVLVSDVVMGGMDGTELAQSLQGRWPGLRVVLMSGNVDETAIEALAPRSAAFLSKPFRPSELLVVVDRLLETAGAASP